MAWTPIKKFAQQESVGLSFLYSEVRKGRLVITKRGYLSGIEDKDANRWRALGLKVTGKAGDIALKVAEQRLIELGKAVAKGWISRKLVIDRLSAVAADAGLKFHHVEHRVT